MPLNPKCSKGFNTAITSSNPLASYLGYSYANLLCTCKNKRTTMSCPYPAKINSHATTSVLQQIKGVRGYKIIQIYTGSLSEDYKQEKLVNNNLQSGQ